MSTSFYHDLGDKLKACRRAKKLTLQQIADVLGKSTSTVSKYENGEISIDLELLIQWCRFLNLDINTVLPSTAPSSAQQELSRYESHFVDRLYIYWYNKALGRTFLAVIENDNLSGKSVCFHTVHNADDIHSADFFYTGTVTYSDISTDFVFYNTAPPFDLLTFSMPALTRKQKYKTGMLSSITFFYQDVILKALASKEPIADEE